MLTGPICPAACWLPRSLGKRLNPTQSLDVVRQMSSVSVLLLSTLPPVSTTKPRVPWTSGGGLGLQGQVALVQIPAPVVCVWPV